MGQPFCHKQSRKDGSILFSCLTRIDKGFVHFSLLHIVWRFVDVSLTLFLLSSLSCFQVFDIKTSLKRSRAFWPLPSLQRILSSFTNSFTITVTQSSKPWQKQERKVLNHSFLSLFFLAASFSHVCAKISQVTFFEWSSSSVLLDDKSQ